MLFFLLLLGGDSAFSVFPNINDAATTTVKCVGGEIQNMILFFVVFN